METGLTASAGIACNKRLAKVGIEEKETFWLGFESKHYVKVASDMNKPNGQMLVAFREEEIVQFVQALNIRKVFIYCFCCTLILEMKIPWRGV